ncbi:hypothetical protein BLX24_05305 [Arsenicibacter rosenii]|uniref:Uncharacterized protein n=1 Tax=Arsenicibacter rosenii TaxID=1750698 RepID=A0A1S2VPC4_9BACT|nr:hypothetical protein BLX24_05305 [Arsenicibacter rosenii]
MFIRSIVQELITAQAISLYQEKVLSMGQAASLVGTDRINFRKLLADLKIPVNYDVDDFQEDLETITQ